MMQLVDNEHESPASDKPLKKARVTMSKRRMIPWGLAAMGWVLSVAAAPAHERWTLDATTRRLHPPQADGALQLFPESLLYPHYLADPRSGTIGAQYAYFPRVGIPEAGKKRFGLKLGGRLGVLRWMPTEAPDVGWQLDLEGGITGPFDIESKTDSLGYDGIYGGSLSWKPQSDWMMRLRYYHNSSHLGDEYIQTTGCRRINCTREEARVGTLWQPVDRCMVYLEGGHSFAHSTHHYLRPWSAQGGLQFVGRPTLWQGLAGWYAALDLSAFQENDWTPNLTLQAGLRLPLEHCTRAYRLGLEYYRGRAQVGELSMYRECTLALGCWVEI